MKNQSLPLFSCLFVVLTLISSPAKASTGKSCSQNLQATTEIENDVLAQDLRQLLLKVETFTRIFPGLLPTEKLEGPKGYMARLKAGIQKRENNSLLSDSEVALYQFLNESMERAPFLTTETIYPYMDAGPRLRSRKVLDFYDPWERELLSRSKEVDFPY